MKPVVSDNLPPYLNRVVGGLALPGTQQGCAIVLGAWMRDERLADRFIIMDEVESWHLDELLRWCNIKGIEHRIDPRELDWLSDGRNTVLQEMCYTIPAPVVPSPIAEFRGLYGYLLPMLRQVVDPTRRQLSVKDSCVATAMQSVTPAGDYKLGDFPAIEAIGFALHDLMGWCVAERARMAQQRPDRSQGAERLDLAAL